MRITDLTPHERHEVIRDTIGFWAPVLVLIGKAVYLHRRERRAVSAKTPLQVARA